MLPGQYLDSARERGQHPDIVQEGGFWLPSDPPFDPTFRLQVKNFNSMYSRPCDFYLWYSLKCYYNHYFINKIDEKVCTFEVSFFNY